MILALLADVHANLEALEACLRHASERGAERFAFLGDLVGYGADPSAVVDRVASCASIVVRGNHEHVLDEWTAGQLTSGQKSFLQSLPVCVREEELCFVHSSACEPEQWRYTETASDARESISAAKTTYTFPGHVHEQRLYFLTMTGKIAPFRPTPGSAVPMPSHRRWMAIVGSSGQPRDGNPAAAYALFDDATETMTFHRVAYDHLAAAEKIRRAALPEWLAYRIENGV